MSTYKQLLLKALIDHSWELIEISNDYLDWWCDEHWRIRSVQECWGLELQICFLVDPQWNLPRKKWQGIWAITATRQFPKGWIEASKGIATLPISKGSFEPRLHQFIELLNKYRQNSPFIDRTE